MATVDASRDRAVRRLSLARDEDHVGVPDDHRVTCWLRRHCAECGGPFDLPVRALDARRRNTAYDIHARRCGECRRPYESPPATPHVRDGQRQALYRWEYSLRRLPSGGRVGAAFKERLTHAECERFVWRVWDGLYPSDRFGPPEVNITPRRTVASGADAEEISLAPRMRNRVVLLHEIGHSYLARILPNGSHAGHGPEFAALYLHLLGKHLRVSKREARVLAEEQRPRRVRLADDEAVDKLLAVGRKGRRSSRKQGADEAQRVLALWG